MFTAQNVEEIIASALSRQAQTYESTFQSMHKKITDLELCDLSHATGNTLSNQSIPAQKTPSAKKKNPATPVNKHMQLVAKATRASQKITQASHAQSEPPMATTSSTSARKKAGPRASVNGSSSVPKKQPNQMTTDDFPEDFKDTKQCFGGQIQLHFKDTNASQLIANDEIITLKDAHVGTTQVGANFIHIDDSYIHYIHAHLAKLGICCWGPNLDEGPKSLFNAACRIAALTGFQQIAALGGYNFLNFNHTYKDDMLLFIHAYNHYVHHVLAKKYRSECNKAGSTKEVAAARNATRNRSRLRDARLKFALVNEFPDHYIWVIQEAVANSNDKWDAEWKCFGIKTLNY
ncbi:hypothetical protein CROQUDRAFT_96295 [Cronartium quercuum f. sp. fusiforme G11]|uniref:Uncharacterized protein n=1 Tax=Cronartium quercuum f. sp. fusiforme G11 TaxID=708437 RepID=A0A9P6NFV0_9BASI|nr:hypothetical protein CROQUDRAFT_96295 [Cronartium quercuum f. sp. fusiforme G11]